MGVRAISPSSVTLPVGGVWLLAVDVRDGDGYPADAVPTVVVTLPDDTTANPIVETLSTGYYRATYTVAAAGRHVAVATAAGFGTASFAAWVDATATGTGMPDVVAVDNYLGDHSYTDADLLDALDAEAAAQRAICRVGAVYPADLRQALLRRVMRNLAVRQLPLAVLQGDAEGGSDTVLPGRDPEVRRLEAPYRKRVVG